MRRPNRHPPGGEQHASGRRSKDHILVTPTLNGNRVRDMKGEHARKAIPSKNCGGSKHHKIPPVQAKRNAGHEV